MPSGYGDLGKKQGGDPNIMQIKEVNRIRPLDNIVAGWKQHGIEHPDDPEQFASVVCPGPRSCPLDRKPVGPSGQPYFPVSRRFAANVWDYETGSVKVLVAGPQVFNHLRDAAQAGINPTNSDWTITKTGTRRSTEYKVLRHDASPFSAAAITPDMLHDVSKYEQPDSTEAIFETLEKFGIDYDALPTPSYTYDEALAFTMPYGKHRGLTVEQLLSTDSEYAEYLHGAKLEQGLLGDPVFLALQTALEERGMAKALEEALAELPEPSYEVSAPPPAQATAVAHQQVDLSPSSASLVKLIGPEGNEVMVPATVVEVMLAQGFKRPEPDPEPQTESSTMRVLINGTEVELPRDTAVGLIAAGTAEEISAAPPTTPEPTLPLPDEQVEVNVGGVTVSMVYVQAATVVDTTPGASFVEPAIQLAHERAKASAAATQDPTGTPLPASASISPAATGQTSSPDDPEKPFKCDQCGAAYKTKGALTQHTNREHGGVESPQPAAAPPPPSNGSVADEVKNLIATAPFAKDYQRLLDLFKEETGGKQNFSQMDEGELLKVKARIEREIAAHK